MTEPRYLLLKGKAGLGNRLLALLGGILHARVTGRQLYVDWSDRGYSHDRSNSFQRFFERPVLVDPAPIWKCESIAPSRWKGNLEISVDELMAKFESDVEADRDRHVTARYTVDPARADPPEQVAVRWAWTDEIYRLRPQLRGDFEALRRLDDETLLRKLLREELTLAEPLRRRVDEFRARELPEVSIGLHVRHSDRKNSYDDYPRLIERIRRAHPKAILFLATDNQAVEEDFRRRFGRVAVTKKWYAPPGVPLHRVRDCPDKLELGFEALVDLYLLGSCDYLVYNASSTFGVFAHLVSQAGRANVFETSPPLEAGKRRLKQWVKELLVRSG